MSKRSYLSFDIYPSSHFISVSKISILFPILPLVKKDSLSNGQEDITTQNFAQL